MAKPIAQRKQTTPVAQDEIEQSLAMLTAKKQFFTVAMNMGWQLAFAVIVPVIIGVKVDDRFNSSPSYTLAAFILAVGMAVYIVSNTIKDVNRESAAAEAEESKTKKGGISQ